MTEDTRRRSGRYAPPPLTGIVHTDLGGLLDGTGRVVPATQQVRLGFVDEQRGTEVWCVGDRSLLRRPCVAIVGARKVSEAGASRARKLAKNLATNGVVVVSGLAMGVDTHAMGAALLAGGSLIGVLGTPLNQATPVSNARLQESVYQNHLLISQFPQGKSVNRGNFPARNRLMAALSDATVIVEASESSGTLHQAAECQRLGRHLFIMKSVADDPRLTWPKRFLDAGARVLSDPSQLMSILG